MGLPVADWEGCIVRGCGKERQKIVREPRHDGTIVRETTLIGVLLGLQAEHPERRARLR
jgi:hypothetical protein